MQLKKTRAPSALDWARWWPAPAKLNVFLHIMGQRDDGYHELETVFQLLDLQDSLHFDARNDGQIIRKEGPEAIDAASDLSVKAAHLLSDYVLKEKKSVPEYCTASNGVDIRCRKRIPVGGGLGGGSSDAATTLLALNHLWECGLSQSELLMLGKKLGADVPVFISGHSAYARGIGEILEPVDLPECWYLIVKPESFISTEKIFANHGLTRATDPITIHGFVAALKDWPTHFPGKNDCQNVVVDEYPDVLQVIDWLNNYGNPRLTGTGSCVFLPCIDQSTAKAVLDQLSFNPDAQNWQMLIAKGLDLSPVCEILSGQEWIKEAKNFSNRK